MLTTIMGFSSCEGFGRFSGRFSKLISDAFLLELAVEEGWVD
jgi:hypothetical protein